MSYEVLARKWRPLSFDDVVGQEHITRTLKKAVETGRISHAYLFSGPRGCGKTSTARILARVINCDNLKDGNPCNTCASCMAVVAGNNLDVMEIDGASHTGVGEVRELQESIGYTPSQSRNKVYIIDEVHMLSTHAFNALLKTLEEPPPHVFFIFATTAPQKIPDTIKSRCQRHHFKRLENAEIAARLAHICKAEKVKYDEDGLRLLARKADGSMRDGTSLLDQCVTASGGNVTAEAVRGILGLIDQEKVLAFVDGMAGGDPGAALQLLDAAVNEGVDLQDLVAALLEGYRDLMLLAVPGDLSPLLFRSRSEIDHLRKSLDRYELADLVTVVERLSNASGRLRTMSDPRIFLESVLVDLSLLERQTDIRTLIARLDGGGGDGGGDGPRRGKESPAARPAGGSASALAPGAAPAALQTNPRRAPRASAEDTTEDDARPAETGSPVPLEGDLDLAKIQQLWEGFVTFVRQKRVSLGVCLISGRPYSFEGGRLHIRFLKGFSLQREQVMRPEGIEFVGGMFKRYFGVDAEIVCFLEGEEKAVKLEEALAGKKVPEERIRDVTEDKRPVVQGLIKDFDGEIVRYNT
ncbi:MAG: DNA polymerase III subunit gamma/tau [Candidatus Krumholzibacteria bacterium]|nr:DNA polymerase III subunit gamma/tau [Candidatus Krumholzibacteria bacterium]MDH4337309.1 DNA polymerase III subunit gamma/tau [Candidatus Krumholzibacteria bacterium]MDH5269978.1 DNA polymerase III subunit gamma/tau [Candidatus Krumholzibacteria bacterium]